MNLTGRIDCWGASSAIGASKPDHGSRRRWVLAPPNCHLRQLMLGEICVKQWGICRKMPVN